MPDVPPTFHQHRRPAWGERADWVIHAALPEPDHFEQLRVRRVGDRRFEVCCIPHFLYDVALGDVVETDEDSLVTSVVQRSGHAVFRVRFGDGVPSPDRSVVDELTALGALHESDSPSLLAVDAEDAQQAAAIAALLHAGEQAGRFTYETGDR